MVSKVQEIRDRFKKGNELATYVAHGTRYQELETYVPEIRHTRKDVQLPIVQQLPIHPLTETPVRGTRRASRTRDEPEAW
jgi:hypothetical protein